MIVDEPILKLMSIAPQVDGAFASSMAARRVQTAPALAHTPSPGLASPASPLSLTVKLVGQPTPTVKLASVVVLQLSVARIVMV